MLDALICMPHRVSVESRLLAVVQCTMYIYMCMYMRLVGREGQEGRKEGREG